MQYALVLNSKVLKLTLSQAITVCVNGDTPESKVIYIECSEKPQGDVEKVSSVLKSLIERLLLDDVYISIFVAPNVVLQLNEYTKL